MQQNTKYLSFAKGGGGVGGFACDMDALDQSHSSSRFWPGVSAGCFFLLSGVFLSFMRNFVTSPRTRSEAYSPRLEKQNKKTPCAVSKASSRGAWAAANDTANLRHQQLASHEDARSGW